MLVDSIENMFPMHTYEYSPNTVNLNALSENGVIKIKIKIGKNGLLIQVNFNPFGALGEMVVQIWQL